MNSKENQMIHLPLAGTEKRIAITGRDTGCTCDEFAAYVMETCKKLMKTKA
jgi:hypothetical protein